MIELQILNKLLKSDNLNDLVKYGIDENYFAVYKDEYLFIVNHFKTYNSMPDKETLIDKFSDFDFIEVNETWEYLVNAINEQNAFNNLVPVIKKSAQIAEGNSIDAIEYLENELQKLKNLRNKTEMGTDIVKDVNRRVEEFSNRVDKGGMLGIPTGLQALDEVMNGMMGEDFITILGRPNQGKSWVMQYFTTHAWKQGYKVLHYSGEMGHTLVGFRFDTLNRHFSNTALTKGDVSIKNDYIEYGKNLKGKPYIVVTPKQIGGMLDVPTLERLINIHKPDIVGVDQLTLMTDYRKARGDGQPAQLGHIAQDLYNLSEKYNIPIIAPHQANRSSDKTADDEETPSLGDAYGSDGVEQNSTRMLSIRRIPVGIKISIIKNRYGENNRDFIYSWDIDKGILTDKPIATQSESETNNKYIEGTDLF